MTGRPGVLLFHDVTCVDEARSLLEHTPAARGYDQRGVLLAGRRDHVIVATEIDPDYLGYLHELGLGPASERVHVMPARVDVEAGQTRAGRLCRDIEWLRALATALRRDGVNQVVVQPYAAHVDMERFARALQVETDLEARIAAGPAELVRKYSSKHEGRMLAERLGLRVPEGSLIDGRPGEIARAVLDRLRRSRPLVVKGLRGAGGSLVWVVGETEGLAAFGEWLSRQSDEVALSFVVEELIPVRCAVNVMLRIDGPNLLTMLGITDQRISDRTTHVGNHFPSTTRCEAQLGTGPCEWGKRWPRRGSRAMPGSTSSRRKTITPPAAPRTFWR
jgi:biotin carboxylase